MLFEVVDSRGCVAMHTSEPTCVPYADLAVIGAAGYQFRVDGKIVSKNKVADAVQQSTGTYIPVQPSAATVVSSAPSVATPANASPTSKAVRCVDTGEIFKNQSEAARAYKIDPAQVSDSIKTGRPRSGYTFERYYGPMEE